MPTVNGRLTCCSCGRDLGPADDPYRDPSCQCADDRDDADCVDDVFVPVPEGFVLVDGELVSTRPAL